ncbi:hypothetical protein [Nocardia ninae]|uniref:Uncharacterized protein n=1 Tax=Nocardia ninae NBRC 108245 TaxID=1210091 RepID=A0A511MPP0_9NOCA|nr:hypothetical protein [Nocardia ninae]GEM42178.1 hypothetical protein NN4_66970 [Nocardia ninae NBRC 108245]
MTFTVYLNDPEVPQGLAFTGDARYSFDEAAILTVQQGGHARFYAPGYWQQVHDYDESQFPTARHPDSTS